MELKKSVFAHTGQASVVFSVQTICIPRDQNECLCAAPTHQKTGTTLIGGRLGERPGAELLLGHGEGTMGWQRPLESETEIWEMMLGAGSRCWDGQPGERPAGRQERGEAGIGTMCSDHTCATYHGTFGPSGACHIRGLLFPSCQQLPLQPDVFRSVHMFPYIVNLTFSRCSFCEREISERPCHSAQAFIFIASCFFRDVLGSVLQMYILYYKVIHIYYISQWCLHPGSEACVITAQDIFFPIFTAGSLVPQWEITFLPM